MREIQASTITDVVEKLCIEASAILTWIDLDEVAILP